MKAMSTGAFASDCTSVRCSVFAFVTTNFSSGAIFSDVKNRKIELRRDVTDDEVIDVLRKGIKRRRESIEMYAGKRDDLADKERGEVTILEAYLPAAVSDAELRAAVKAAIAAGASQIGAVMGKVLPQFKGRAEGSAINAIAREELARQG